MEIDTSTFFPYKELFGGTLKENVKNFYFRSNADIFRISVDLAILLLIFYFFRKKINSTIYSWIVGVYYVILLLFLIYYTSMTKIFLIEPILYNDLYLLKLGFYNVGGNLVAGLLVMGLTLILIYAIVRGIRYLLILLQAIQFSIYSKVVFTVTGLLFIYLTIRAGTAIRPEHAFQETLGLIIDNIQRSTEAHRIHAKLKNTDLKKVLNYSQYQWKKKPNVYIFFFESYGNILNTDSKLQKPYSQLLKTCENSLYSGGWHIVSNLSTSPISGGGSWISYSSFMLGFNVKDQGTFLYLLHNPEKTNYDQFFRLFRKKGYTNYRLTSVPEEEGVKIPWKNFTDFFAVDKWILYKDLQFKGVGYGFGPSPPDQYALCFAGDYLQKEENGPYTMFFINQNSHHPFYSPDSVVPDWKSLNDSTLGIKQKSVFFKRPDIKNYLQAISYDLNVFAFFISNFGKNDDIFLIIGDHQPPFLTTKKDGFETPVHIISRDSAFVSGFRQYGFNPGLLTNNTSVTIKHQGFYTLFMREFLRQYGADSTRLPEYLPDGLF
jgi:hypothetical protein